MEKGKGMSDRTLREKLKHLKYTREIKNYLTGLDSDYTDEIKKEFGRRKVSEYKSKTVDAKLAASDISELDLSKVKKEYSLKQLYQMGILKVSITDFKEKTGKSDEEIEPYITKNPAKEPRLTVNIKPEVKEETIKELAKVISNYPKT